MIDGILLIDKQEGITSYDVIRKLKRILQKGQKIGHAGTLDPFATGLLVILLGKGTKQMESFHTLSKEYIVTARLCIATDTQDITGEIVSENKEVRPTLDDILKSIENNLVGNISQVPPQYSAKKVDGKRAYDVARAGGSLELKPKDIFVERFEIVKYEYPELVCNIRCSTGTYVRTLVHDLGVLLGSFATATALRRVGIGDFSVEGALSSSDVESMDEEKIYESSIDVSKVIEILNNGKR